jgi:hypothetical protein
MKIGSLDIDKMFIGSEEVDSVYFGTTQIYSKSIPDMFAWYRGGITDLSGHGNDLTLFNGASFSGVGAISTPLVLDGTNDYATFPEVTFSGDFAIAFWLNGNSGGDFVFGQIDGNSNYISWNSDTDMRLQINSAQIWTGIVTQNAGWNHYVIKREGQFGTCYLYVNGVKESNLKNMTGDFVLSTIGRILGGGYYAGEIDDVRIFTKTLGDAEVLDVYNNVGDNPEVPINDTTLLRWYLGSHQDQSGYDEDLTIFNGASFTGTGPVSTPLVLDGTNDYASFTQITFSGDFSICWWSNGNIGSDFIFGQIDGNTNYISWNSNTNIRLQINSAQIWTDVVEDNAGWNHFVIKREGEFGTCYLYVNGRKQTSLKNMTGDFILSTIGRIQGGGYYQGELDSIRMYSKSLTDENVLEVYRDVDGEINDVDLFLVAGQSNCEGQGDSNLSDIPAVGEVYENSSLVLAVDPVDTASTGSMWPAFAKEWFLKTGRKAIIVSHSQDGSSLTPEADSGYGNFSPSGTHRSTAVTKYNAAKTWIQANTTYVIHSENVMWCQGENDAYYVSFGSITGEDYEQALEDLAAYWKTELNYDQMYVIQTGRKVSGNQDGGYAAIRQAQVDACADSTNLTMTFTGAVDFSTSGKMVDDVHWDQVGLNEAGKGAAALVAIDKGF